MYFWRYAVFIRDAYSIAHSKADQSTGCPVNADCPPPALSLDLPGGEKQEERKPKYPQYFKAVTVVAGDCHYIKRYMPDDMKGKIVVTNTTTPEDVELFRKCGVKYLITTTPVLEGRSFGTNMMEAALVAISGKNRPLSWDEYNVLLEKLGFEPQLQELN